MVRMLVIGYCFGIRSERRLCEEVHLNLAYRWFCQLVPLHVIDEAVRRIRDGSITEVTYDPQTARLVG
jgi:transposase